jgi:hypothetical protein
MNLFVFLLALLLPQGASHQVTTLRSRFGPSASSIVPIHRDRVLILPGSLTRLPVIRPHCPSHSSWCLFSTSSSNNEINQTLPSLEYSHNQTAFDYFNNLYFFDDDDNRQFFVNKFSRFTEEKKKVLLGTLDEFFQTAWGKEQANRAFDLTLFFTSRILCCLGDKVLEAYNKWKEINDIENEEIDVDGNP